MAISSTASARRDLEMIRTHGVIPVVDLDDAAIAEPLFGALVRAGLPVVEITLRTPAGVEALGRIATDAGDGLVGVGTVLTIEDARRVIEAGARFVVSPATNPEIIELCRDAGILVIPGACTATEIDTARRAGAPVVKLFPAGPAGGPELVRALAAPFPDVTFIPTGGITAATLADYLAIPQVAACGGSWLISRAQLDAGDFAAIERGAREARAIATDVRQDA